MTTSQWNFDHGRRSSRAGILVLIVAAPASAVMLSVLPLWLGRRRRRRSD
jgi:hypothetical protein